MNNISKIFLLTCSIIILLSCAYKDSPDLNDKKFGFSWNSEREKRKIPLIEKSWKGSFSSIEDSTQSVFWTPDDDVLLENMMKFPEKTYPPQHNQKEIVIEKGNRVKEGDFYTNLLGETHYTLTIFFTNLNKFDRDSSYAVLFEDPNGKILKKINKQQSIAFKDRTLKDFKNPKMAAYNNALMSDIYQKYVDKFLPLPAPKDLTLIQADSILKKWKIVQDLPLH